HYGWAVPFLAAYAACRRYRRAPRGDFGAFCLAEFDSPSGSPRSPRPGGLPGVRPLAAGLSLAFLLSLLPLRLVQEANSDSRLVSWAFGLTILGLACAGTCLLFGWQTLRRNLFPIAFIVVAIPWPWGFENVLIVHLSRLNAAFSIEVLNWIGIPAIQRGNLIELASGIVEIDAACS